MEKYKIDFYLGNVAIEREAEEIDENFDNRGRADIKIRYPTKNGFMDEKTYYIIECKILNKKNDIDYIKNGLYDFITGKYSKHNSNAFMIAYVENGEIKNHIKLMNKRLDDSNDIETIQNLISCNIFNIKDLYLSKHERIEGLDSISLYHFIFDYRDIYVDS